MKSTHIFPLGIDPSRPRFIAPCALLTLLLAAHASAGEIYGTVIGAGGKPQSNLQIKFTIEGKPKLYEATTDAQGYYRLYASETGKGTLVVAIAGARLQPAIDVFSSDEAVPCDLLVDEKRLTVRIR